MSVGQGEFHNLISREIVQNCTHGQLLCQGILFKLFNGCLLAVK